MNTIEISIETAEGLIPCLVAKLQIAEANEKAAKTEAEDARKQLAELRAKIANNKVGATPAASGGVRDRLPKGHGDKLIYETLKSLPNGEGITMAEIKRRTGINHSTIFRTLNEEKRNKGRFVADGNLWRVKTAK